MFLIDHKRKRCVKILRKMMVITMMMGFLCGTVKNTRFRGDQ